ncbi:MAG: hypothetical protein COY80_01600 [Candidatus Pacebacteria bacterium CG_4_10_14_0_8_um_filter_42_14]|nr:MAG: hypothetical protein COY80_01600 [Candidatus Pacebacteria bacterium CG_4_10_14_0_8_um_filter_42_14]
MHASVKPPPELKKRNFSTKQLNSATFSLGQKGESGAVKYLIAKNYHILDRNIGYKRYEADIIAIDPDTEEMVFVEVKTRSSSYFGEPSTAINAKKLRALRRFAAGYLKENKHHGEFRIDCITVIPGTIQHYKNVTWLF